MTHFEAYRWEDHVPRAGSWKFNLAAGMLALALIATALPDTSDHASATATATAPTSDVHDPEMETSTAPTVQPIEGWWAYCPTVANNNVDT